MVLLGALGIPAGPALLYIVVLALVCCVAAHFLLRLVEGKRHGFTVGGTSFVGALVAWPVAQFVTAVSPQEATLPLLPLFAAVGIAYTLGESVGRLACISFGCCYGKPVRQAGRLWAWHTGQGPSTSVGIARRRRAKWRVPTTQMARLLLREADPVVMDVD